ncbi:MAG: exo-alpha-sialidase [Chloroflexi bacterium]|nr:exo-alpha-sialidase [Chloroflexota bacterium]
MKKKVVFLALLLGLIALGPFASLRLGTAPVHGEGPVGPRLKLNNARPGPSGIVSSVIPGKEALEGMLGAAPPRRLQFGEADRGRGRLGDSLSDGYAENIVFNLDTTFLPQNEPWVAINPANPDNIIAGANDYRRRFTPTAGAPFVIGSGAYFSMDGGRTVQEGVRPAVPGVTGPVTGILFPIDFNIPEDQGGPRAYQGSGDPAIDFDGFGNAYYTMLGFHFEPPPLDPFVFDNGIFMFKSSDGGATWSQQMAVSENTPPDALTVFEDKEFIAVDKRTSGVNPGYIAVTWTRFEFTFPDFEFASAKILLAISTDQGATWSSLVEVSDSIANQFSTPIIDRDGNLFVEWADFVEETGGAIVKVRKAASQGVVDLGPVHTVVVVPFEHFIGFGAPLPIDQTMPVAGSQSGIPRLATYPKFAIDTSESPLAGKFYVVWDGWSEASQQLGFVDGALWARGSDIFLRSSDDQGATWSPTVRVNRDGSGGNDQFMPALAVDPSDGSLHVAFYDARLDPYNRLVQQVVATSRDGGRRFEERVATAPLENPGIAAPNALDPPFGSAEFRPGRIAATDLTHDIIFGTRFFGDYNGLAVLDDRVFVIFTDTRALKRGPAVQPDEFVSGPFFQEDGVLAALVIRAEARRRSD